MCGICGIIAGEASPPIEAHTLLAMRDILTHRGPDDAGIFLEGRAGLGSRRLAVLDPSERGHMPMFSADGRYVIVYNGEVYNYRQLKSDLEANGHSFRSNTDTEVLLALYAMSGPEMLPHLNGMFAIAIWDRHRETLFLARDRLGIKPVYYAYQRTAFYFASEIKSLVAGGIEADFDHSVWTELLCFRYLAGEATPYRQIKELLPGHYLIFSTEGLAIRRWWNLSDHVRQQREIPCKKPVEQYRLVFDEAVRLQRISDVPLGVLLSGGLDSSSLAASLAAQGNPNLDSFTVRFEDTAYDEGTLAKQVADRWYLKFHELFVTPDKIFPFLREAVWLNDEPLAHGNEAHILAIARLAKPLVTVLLCGEGADETLGGYVRYRPLLFGRWLKLGAPFLSRLDQTFEWSGRWHKLVRFLRLESLEDFVLFNACDVLPCDLEKVGYRSAFLELEYRRKILAEAQQTYPGEPVRQAMYLDLHTFLVSELDRIDRMSMGASIEARVPFLDHRLVSVTASWPTREHFSAKRGKHILRRAFSERLPRSILSNRKWGFGVPWIRYYRQIPELRDWVAGMHRQSLLADSPLDTSKVRSIAEKFLQGDDSNNALIHQLVMITLWWQETRSRNNATR